MPVNSVYIVELAIGIAALLIWIVLVCFRGGFWRIFTLRGAPFKPGIGLSGVRRIAVIIPARNEADVIGRAITSLLQQNTDAELHIFVVDDASTDGTADAAQEAASALGQQHRVTILSAGPLPPGWSGKLWAVRAGIERACALHPAQASPGLERGTDYLLLIDADVVHAPDSLATLISIAEAGPYDLTSFMVKLHCKSVAERFLIPAFVYFFFKLYPPRWIANPRHKTAGAAGGCMLVRPEALERAGGIDAIRSEIIDDCALAHRIKATGGRVWLGLASPLKSDSGLNGAPVTASIRPYKSLGAIEHMIARTAFNQLRHSSLLLLGCIVGLTLTYGAPLALLFSRHLVPTVLGVTALVLMVGSYVPMVRYYGLNPFWALSLPAAALFYMAATIHSALNYWTGRGGQWKGRAQDQQMPVVDSGH